MNDFTIHEALQTKKYHSMNIINYNGERIVYDVLNLKPPSNRYKKVNRMDVYNYSNMKYGAEWA